MTETPYTPKRVDIFARSEAAGRPAPAPDTLGNLLVAAEMPMILVNDQLRLEWFTPPAARFLKLSEDDLGVPVSMLSLRADDVYLKQDMATIWDAGGRLTAEVPLEDEVWYLREVRRIEENDRAAGLLVVYVEISEQRRALERTQARARQLQNLADALPALLAFVDAAGYFRFANASFEDWFGVSPVELVGLAVDELFGEAMVGGAQDHITAALSGRRVVFEADLEHRRLGMRAVQIAYVPPEADGDFAPEGFYALVTDITARKRRENQMLDRQSKWERSSRVAVVGETAGTIAHQLNQPLGAIAGYAGALKNRLVGREGTEDLMELSKKIALQARSAGEILEGLRHFITHGGGELEPVDVAEFITHVLMLVEGRIEVTAVDVTQHVDANANKVFGVRLQLEQLLINLLINAIEAVAELDVRKLEVSAIRVEDWVDIRVMDSGEGVSSEHLGHIFEVFYSTKEQGMGMGLAIARSIAEQHGGRLWAETRDDGGMIMCLRLPIARAGSAG